MCWEPIASIPLAADLRAYYTALGAADDSARLNGGPQQPIVSAAVLLTRYKLKEV